VAVRDAKTFLLPDDKTSPLKSGFAQFIEIRETLQVLSLDIASEKIVTLATNSCFPSASAATNASGGGLNSRGRVNAAKVSEVETR
jgi:hypothetical protein